MDDAATRIAGVRWFHAFDFGNGLYTKDAVAAQRMRDRADLVFRHPVAGKTVLDIGAWDGLFSFEAERRGARRVLATDHFCWSGEGWGTRAGFDLARELLQSRVEDQDIDVLDITPDTTGTWDVVLFLGVLYHVTDPLGCLRRVRAVTREMAVIETALDLEELDRPALSFVNRSIPDPRVPLSTDRTNFFGPNAHAVIAMLEHVGFSRVEKYITDAPAPRSLLARLKRRAFGRATTDVVDAEIPRAVFFAFA